MQADATNTPVNPSVVEVESRALEVLDDPREHWVLREVVDSPTRHRVQEHQVVVVGHL